MLFSTKYNNKKQKVIQELVDTLGEDGYRIYYYILHKNVSLDDFKEFLEDGWIKILWPRVTESYGDTFWYLFQVEHKKANHEARYKTITAIAVSKGSRLPGAWENEFPE